MRKRNHTIAALVIGLIVPVLFMLVSAGTPQAQTASLGPPPPVAAPLVREGDYAVRIAYALRVATTDNEIEAESRLAEAGIAPRNGWIADYPVTPDVLNELQSSLLQAAASGRLGFSPDEALKYMGEVNRQFGFDIAPAQGGTESQAPPATPGYTNPAVINNYYMQAGPPVVTYYEPPPAFVGLYAWVPSPFWFEGFWFPGFFILHDFHRHIVIRGRPVIISNHFIDRDRRVHRIEPLERFHGRARFGGEIRPRERAIPRVERRPEGGGIPPSLHPEGRPPARGAPFARPPQAVPGEPRFREGPAAVPGRIEGRGEERHEEFRGGERGTTPRGEFRGGGERGEMHGGRR